MWAFHWQQCCIGGGGSDARNCRLKCNFIKSANINTSHRHICKQKHTTHACCQLPHTSATCSQPASQPVIHSFALKGLILIDFKWGVLLQMQLQFAVYFFASHISSKVSWKFCMDRTLSAATAYHLTTSPPAILCVQLSMLWLFLWQFSCLALCVKIV